MDDDAAGPARPLRQGEAWSEREYEQLVHAVAGGEPVAEGLCVRGGLPDGHVAGVLRR